jgi:predicted Zn finger-like uncharacterized protein
MSYLLLACPNCHAAYKIPSERARTDVTCRACGHTWVPGPAASAPVAVADAPLVLADQSPVSSRPVGRPGPAQAAGKVADAAAAAKVKPHAPPPKPPAPAKTATEATPHERPDPLVGTTINGFKILDRIGSGGFGIVYRAFDTNLERSVAIKMLPPKLAKSGQGLMDRFLREARSAAKLGHPNIVTIHQICPYKETFYIVMELIDGGALHEFLQMEKRFAPVEATRIIRLAAEGLGHAHRRGIIHRDVKPGNIMMTNDRQVKVSDFGLARDVLQSRDIVGEGHCLGTPRYMAPEQARGDQPTAASDLYSLAATYYALVTGRAPFDGDDEREIMKKQVTEPVPDPRQFVPTLPISLFRFFEKAMAKDPEERYLTADEFIAALDRLDFGMTESGSLTPQSLAAQIGPIPQEDRTTHLTQTLGAAVRRAQRQQRTPMGEQVLDGSGSLSVSAPSRGLSSAAWALIAVGLVVLLAGAVVVAVLLARSGNPPSPKIEAPPTSKPPQVAVNPQPPAPSSSVPAAMAPAPTRAGSAPAEKNPVKPAPVGTPSKPMPVDAKAVAAEFEQLARDVYDSIKKEESNPQYTKDELVRMYEDNLLSIKEYRGTKAAADAEAAVKRLRTEQEARQPAPSP